MPLPSLILISSPAPVTGEAVIINRLFGEGLRSFHLRKPDDTPQQLNALLATIDPVYHERIVLPATLLQDNKVVSFPGRQLHFFEFLRKKTAPDVYTKLEEDGYALSTSIHDAATYHILPHQFSYTFIGPVFNSISKKGHCVISSEELSVLQQKGSTGIIALGGIQKDNCRQALDMGFDGVAVLGAVWQAADPVAAFKQIQACITTGQ